MTEQERRQAIEEMSVIDDAADQAGGYVANFPSKDTHYNYRAIMQYCREKGIEPIDMTIRELNTFIVH